MYDTIANSIVPTLLVFILNLALLVRVYIRKRQLSLRNQWRNQRKMILQLLSLASLLLIFDFPLAILLSAHFFGLPSNDGLLFSQYAYFFTYFIPLLSQKSIEK